MKRNLKISTMAAAALVGTMIMTGCSSNDGGGYIPPVPASSSITAADGYVVDLNGTNATANCNGTIQKSTSNGILTKGKIVFTPSLTSDCTVTVPSNAIIDRNNNGVKDAGDTAIGYQLQAPGDASYVSQLTTLVVAKKKAGDTTGAAELLAAVKNYNPVTAAHAIATGTDTATVNKLKKLVTLAEVAKVALRTSTAANVATDINTTAYTDDTNSTDLNISSTISTTGSLNTNTIDAVNAKAASIQTIVNLLDQIDTTKINVNTLLVNISDSDQNISEAIQTATDYNETNATAIFKASSDVNQSIIDTIDSNISTANVANDFAAAAAPARISFGNTINIGSQSATLSGDAFSATLDANETNLLQIALPSITLSKGFDDENITVTINVKNDETSQELNATLTNVSIVSNDANTSINTTIGTSSSVTVSQNGLYELQHTIGNDAKYNFGNSTTNTDLAFDIQALVDNLGSSTSAPDALNVAKNYLTKSGIYTVTISFSFNNDNLTAFTDYSELTVTVTVR